MDRTKRKIYLHTDVFIEFCLVTNNQPYLKDAINAKKRYNKMEEADIRKELHCVSIKTGHIIKCL